MKKTKVRRVWVLTAVLDGQSEPSVLCAWDHEPSSADLTLWWKEEAEEQEETMEETMSGWWHRNVHEVVIEERVARVVKVGHGGRKMKVS